MHWSGGSHGIEHVTALALADYGAHVVITYEKNKDAAKNMVAELEAKGVRAASIQVNLTGTSKLDRLAADFQEILSRWNRTDFDFLVNSVGILCNGEFDR